MFRAAINILGYTLGVKYYIYIFGFLIISAFTGVIDLLLVVFLSSVLAELFSLNDFIVPLGGYVPDTILMQAFIFCILSALRFYLNYVTTKVGQVFEAKLSTTIFSNMLSIKLTDAETRTSADFKRQILSEVQQLSNNFIYPSLRIMQVAPSLIAVASLLYLQIGHKLLPYVLLMLLIIISLQLVLRTISQRLGTKRFTANERKFAMIEDAFVNLRLIKILKTGTRVQNGYWEASKRYAESQVWIQMLGQFPKLFTEFTIVLSIGLFATLYGGLNGEANLSVIFSALYRLAPNLQMCMQNLTRISYSHRVLVDFEQSISVLKGREVLREQAAPPLTGLAKISGEYGIELRVDETEVESFTMRNLQTTILTGPSGIGKTTILDQISGLKDHGKVNVERGISSQSVFYVPQIPYFPAGNVRDILTYYGLDNKFELLPEYLDQFHLGHLKERLCIDLEILGGSQEFSGLSGGEMKRLFTIFALLSNREALLFDEPYSGLDDVSSEYMTLLLNDLFGTTTLVIVTHVIPQNLKFHHQLSLRKTVNEQ